MPQAEAHLTHRETPSEPPPPTATPDGCATKRRTSRHGKPRKGCVRVNVVLPEPLARDLRDMGRIFKTPVSAILEQAAVEWLRREFAADVLRIFRAESDREAERVEREILASPCPDVETPLRPAEIPAELLDHIEALTAPQLLQVARYAADVARAPARAR